MITGHSQGAMIGAMLTILLDNAGYTVDGLGAGEPCFCKRKVFSFHSST